MVIIVYLNIDETHGVGGKQMPNYEMKKDEDWSFDMISGREMVNSNDEETSGDKVKFF
jgi:hypothetical protein